MTRGMAAFVLCAAAIASCDASTETVPAVTSSSTGTGAGGSGGADEGGGGAEPLPECDPVPGAVFVADRLFLGDTDFDGNASATAWKGYAFTIDELTTTNGDYTGHCQPFGGAPQSVLDDGDAGNDNSFGHNLLPLFEFVVTDFPQQINDGIVAGQAPTFMMKLDALIGTTTAKAYGAAPYFFAPLFDGTDCWPVTAESLLDPRDPESAKAVFDGTIIADDNVAALSGGPITLTLGVAPLAVTLTIHEPRFTMVLDNDHQGAVRGLLGGILDTEAFVEEAHRLFATMAPELCSGNTWDSIESQIRQAQDILSDGTQSEMVPCNAISFGIGFHAEAVRFGAVAPPQRPPADPCR
jgi:hypothetical protein